MSAAHTHAAANSAASPRTHRRGGHAAHGEIVRSKTAGPPVDQSVRLFDVAGSRADVAYAQELLDRVGVIPASNRSAHRGAVQLWRDHCDHPRSHDDLRARLTGVLEEPQLDLPFTFAGPTDGDPLRLMWVRPEDIIAQAHPGFPYHHTAEGLVSLAARVLSERGDPEGMNGILGMDYGLRGIVTTGRPLLTIAHNGRHRTAALRAAGFPAVLARVAWVTGPFTPPVFTAADRGYLRLLLRAGLAQLADSEWPTTHVQPGDSVLFDLLRTGQLDAYESLRGHQAHWPDWLRSPHLLARNLEAELIAEQRCPDLSRIEGTWPPPEPGLLARWLFRLSARLRRRQ